MTTATASPLTARRSGPLRGRVRVPGDKSISLRSLILGALAVGETRITGMLEGEDAISTANAMRALGAAVERTGERRLARARRRRRRLRRAAPRRSISAIPAPAAGWRWGRSPAARSRRRSTATPACARGRCGASSIRWSRWARARSSMREGGRLPLTLQGARDPMPIEYEAPVPSAQLKSAVLLAGLAAPGATTVIEKEATRDHTEKMLKHFGAQRAGRAASASTAAASRSRASPSSKPRRCVVPADPSSAAFPLVAALIVPGSEIDPRRRDDESAAHRPAHDAAARWARRSRRWSSATRAARTSPICACKAGALKGVDVPAERAPTMIDEYPILAVAAAFAEGTTRMRGLKELRVKESDRLAATAAMLRGNGVDGRDRGRRPDRARQGPRAGRRRGRDPHGSPHRDVGAGDGARQRAAGRRSTTRPSSPRASRASPS